MRKLISSLALVGLVALGTANLISQIPKTANAQTFAQTVETIQEATSENTKIDIDQVEFDSSTKFGTRINQVFELSQIKTEACSDIIATGKFDSNTKATVIKSIKTACVVGQTKQSWLKLVWDNGLIGWVQNPNETNATASQIPLRFEGVPQSGGVVSSLFNLFEIKASANSVTCKDFGTQIIDLKILNQYPNLDLNDNGVGCDGLPKNPNDPQQIFKNSFDTDGSGRVNCADFDSQVIDSEVLALFPRLDADSDGIGCESNSGVNVIASSNLLNGFAGSYNPYSEDVQLDQAKLSNNTSDQNWSSLGANLVTVLQSDYRALFGSDADCNSFDFGCQMTQSLAGLGRRGMWFFHFTTGILQGIGQSIADLLTMIFDLVSKGLGAVQNILDGLYSLITNPSLIVKLVYDELEGFTNGDYLGRANKLGRLIGSVLLDGIEFFTGIGIGALVLNAVSKIATATKVTSKIMTFAKFVGKGYKIADKFEIALKTVRNGVGIAREQAVKFAQTLSNSDWLDFVRYVDDADKPALQQLRDLLQKCASEVASFDIWSIFEIKANAQVTAGLCDTAKLIKADLQAKFPTDFDPIKYDALVKGKTNTQVGEITANLYKDKDLWKKTVVLRSVGFENISATHSGGKHLRKGLDEKALIQATLNNQSSRYKLLDSDVFKLELKALNEGFLDPNSKYVWYKHTSDVGYSNGKPTKYLRLDVSQNPKTFHGHPVINANDGLTKDILLKLGK